MGGAGAGCRGCGCRPSPHHGGNGGGGHVPRGVPTALGVRVPAGGGQRARTPTPFTCDVVQPKPFLRNDSWRQCTPTAAAWRASSVHEPVALPRASPRACVHARAYRCERIRRRELRGGCTSASARPTCLGPSAPPASAPVRPSPPSLPWPPRSPRRVLLAHPNRSPVADRGQGPPAVTTVLLPPRLHEERPQRPLMTAPGLAVVVA